MNQHEHEKRVEVLMQRLENAGMTLNRSNCVFSKNEVAFLGHRVSDKDIASDPEKKQTTTGTNKQEEVKKFF